MEPGRLLRAAAQAVVLFLALQGIGGAYTIVNFESSSPYIEAKLSGPDDTCKVEIRVPAECHILRAGMNLTALDPDLGHPAYPDGPRVFLNNSLLWEFNGSAYGALGMQDMFVDGSHSWQSGFGAGGGANSTSVRIPWKALVDNAVMEAGFSGPTGLEGRVNFSGKASNDRLGQSVSDAGDVNGDGYADVLVAACADAGTSTGGVAYIFFGGASMDGNADVVMNAQSTGEGFGCSVSSAGDVNNDSYDDVIVGAFSTYYNGPDRGAAYVFLGGPMMDGKADVDLIGEASGDFFGKSVSGAGDVNGDGYDDVVVGAFGNDAGGMAAGRAYVFFGGNVMDRSPDVIMTGEAASDIFGCSVSGGVDVNTDGFDDVIVGASGNIAGGVMAGRAYVFFGAASMDAAADLVYTGVAAYDGFGGSVSGAGDVNGDGYDDVLVGATGNDRGATDAGGAFVFFGGPIKDTMADLNLTGETSYDCFGAPVSDAGDINTDGFDDLVVGAYGNDAGGDTAGRAYVYFGGPSMNGTPDATFTGMAAGDLYGYAVSGSGDVNRDGCDDVIVGALQNDSAAGDAGRAYLYCGYAGVLGPSLSVGKQAVLGSTGYLNGKRPVANFSRMLNDYLRGPVQVVTDIFGNAYVDVPVVASSTSAGILGLGGLNITYNYTAIVPDFSDGLNSYIAAHKQEKDATGRITVPFKVRSRTPSRVLLHNLNITVDAAPDQQRPIPDLAIDEDTANSRLVDLHRYFQDDYADLSRLKFELACATFGDIVAARVTDNRYISVDAASGKANDNWTGAVDMVVNVSDQWGSRTVSNMFRVDVTEVPDMPVITSTPPLNAATGQEYSYRLTADDGDRDLLTYSLANGPGDMLIGGMTGDVSWMPLSGGRYQIILAVYDGMFTVYQNFTIEVANRPPKLVNATVPTAYAGVQYTYDVLAEDDDNDTIVFSLVSGPPGMTIDTSKGRILWTPAQTGVFGVSVRISDGNDTVVFDFNVTVLRQNRPPSFSSVPVTTGIAGLPYTYNATAWDLDGDPVIYSLAAAPPGLLLDASSGKMNWTPSSAGNFTVRLKTSDGMGGEAFQEFTINVSKLTGPRLVFLTPIENKKVKGTITVAGRAFNGTLDVVIVQVRVDDGPWGDANGTSIWLFPLETSKLKNGRHTLQARGFDGVDYSEAVERTMTVDNAKSGGKEFIPGFELIWAVAAVGSITCWIQRKKREQ